MDLINSKLCPLNLSGLDPRSDGGAREQTFYTVSRDGYNGGINQIVHFFSPLSIFFFVFVFLLCSFFRDATRRPIGPAVAGPVELRNYRPALFALLSCLACFVLLAFARFSVNSDITH